MKTTERANRTNDDKDLFCFICLCTKTTFKKWNDWDEQYSLVSVKTWALLPEQEEEAIDLQHNSNDGPANEHHKHTSQKEPGGLHLVLLEEEPEGPLQPDDKRKASNEQDLRREKRVGSTGAVTHGAEHVDLRPRGLRAEASNSC